MNGHDNSTKDRAAQKILFGQPLSGSLGCVVLGGRVISEADQGNRVQGVVGVSIASAVATPCSSMRVRTKLCGARIARSMAIG